MSNREELAARAARLAQELDGVIDQVTVVVGTSPALYEMDERVAVRATKDIDLILRSPSPIEWRRFVSTLEDRGFRYPVGEPVCRYRKNDLIVDGMPADASQLRFGNRWYEEAAAQRMESSIPGLHVVTPICFVATKLDAFASRGADAPMLSHDLDDIVVVVQGVDGLITEIERGDDAVHAEVRRQLAQFVALPDALDIIRAHRRVTRRRRLRLPRSSRVCEALAGLQPARDRFCNARLFLVGRQQCQR